MKKFAFIAALIFASCTGGNDTQKTEQAIDELMEAYAKERTKPYDDITAEYDKKEDCLSIEMDGKMLNACYEVYYKDLLTDNPSSYAKSFLISMVLFDPEVKMVYNMEFKIDGISFKASPSMVNKYNNSIALGFSSGESYYKAIELISHINVNADIWLNTNKGKIEIPYHDVTNLQAMAISYRMDGGTFE